MSDMAMDITIEVGIVRGGSILSGFSGVRSRFEVRGGRGLTAGCVIH
jgi:hypothetical protein